MSTNLHEAPNQLDEDLQRMKEWLSKQPHLPQDIDEQFLKGFIKGCKSLEIAKKRIDNWCTAKTKLSNVYSYEKRNFFSEEWKRASRATKMCFLPKLSNDGLLVMITNAGDDFSYASHDFTAARLQLMLELALHYWPEMKGLMTVHDFDKSTVNVLMSVVDVNRLFTMNKLYQDCYPKIFKRTVLMNTLPFVDKLINLLKPLYASKTVSQIFVAKGSEILRQFISEDAIPVDYGGKEKSINELNDEWLKKLEENADFLKKMTEVKVDESKRQDKSNAFGIEGTFRTLQID